MKIVLMSDSHGHTGRVVDVALAEQDAELILHAGDVEDSIGGLDNIKFVAGNNDYYSDLANVYEFNTPYGKGLLLHSHQVHGFKKPEALLKLAKQHGYAIICFGHTHVPHFSLEDGIYLINPGSLYYNRDGSDLGYFVLEINSNEIKANFKKV